MMKRTVSLAPALHIYSQIHGDRIVKVQFIEYVGKRKKKVTHIEVKEAKLDEMLKKNDKPVQAQFSLF
jgi:hypothetical protein